MFPFQTPKKTPADYFYEIRLSPQAMELLEALAEDVIAKNRRIPAQAGERLKTVLAGARKLDHPLVELPWGKLHDMARERHCSDAEAIYDWKRR